MGRDEATQPPFVLPTLDGAVSPWVLPLLAMPLPVEPVPGGDVVPFALRRRSKDEAGQSRLWGGIHIQPDGFAGRRVGHRIGLDAVALASHYFDPRSADPR